MQKFPPFLQSENVLALIQTNGLLACSLKGFEPRPQQQQMTANVLEAFHQNKIALIEAGTGTGKSLAYLIPAVLWAVHHEERIVISTNTIALQEQLLHKDIPQLIKSLNLEIKVVLVKGMNNYLCLRKLHDATNDRQLFPSEEDPEIEKIEQWSRTHSQGSRSDLPFIPSSSTWDRLGAESEACSHQKCPYYHQCYFFKARNQAQEARLLVVNHHLLFLDLMKRANNNNYEEISILPHYKRLILDEAHHIEDVATEHFASRLNRLELLRILSRLSTEKQPTSQGKLPILREKMYLACSKAPSREIDQILLKLSLEFPALKSTLQEKIHHAFDCFAHFMDYIKQPYSSKSQEETSSSDQKLRIRSEHQLHSKWNEEVIPQAEQLMQSLKEYHGLLNSLEGELKLIDHERLQDYTKSVRLDIQSMSMRLQVAADILRNFFSKEEPPNKVRWIESQQLKTHMNVQVVDANLDVSELLANFLFSKFATVILCSATLSTNKKFDFIRQRLGLNHNLVAQRLITENIYDSPFDYQKQAILAVPTDMPPPTHEDFNDVAFENVWKAIEASHGNAFVLFTSYTMLENCYAVLSKRLKDRRYPIFKQGDDHRQALLSSFKTTPRAVLFGTDSFWEGVDVVGDALRCVIIVKLPFKVPSEPMIQARTEEIIKKGGDPFFEYTVPHAIVKFKQGFGRLIRHKKDRGCIVCLDIRLVTKGYGKLFLDSLPPCGKLFMNGDHLWPKISEFYRNTYYLTKHNSFTHSS